jgi:hypothetical protein
LNIGQRCEGSGLVEGKNISTPSVYRQAMAEAVHNLLCRLKECTLNYYRINNDAHYLPQITSVSNRLTFGSQCAWALLTCVFLAKALAAL